MVALFIILTILLTACGQICLKKSTISGSYWSLFSNHFIWAGLILYGLSTLTYLVVLRHVKLSVAFPVIFGGASTIVAILACIFIREALTLPQVSGIIVIALGVWLLMVR